MFLPFLELLDSENSWAFTTAKTGNHVTRTKVEQCQRASLQLKRKLLMLTWCLGNILCDVCVWQKTNLTSDKSETFSDGFVLTGIQTKCYSDLSLEDKEAEKQQCSYLLRYEHIFEYSCHSFLWHNVDALLNSWKQISLHEVHVWPQTTEI